MEGERITLRLEGEDLELIDDFIDGHPEISNRSQLARIALRAFIERDGGARVNGSGKGEIVLRVPPVVSSIMEGMVEDGYYNSVEDIVVECLRKEFVSRDNLEKVKDEHFQKSRQIMARM
ncbi:MAG: ribbon-helix-helix domain-containing protein [Methanomassiliicoccales archaeon]